MYQLIKSTSFGGISVEESLSLSFLQEKMRKDFQEITKNEICIRFRTLRQSSVYSCRS